MFRSTVIPYLFVVTLCLVLKYHQCFVVPPQYDSELDLAEPSSDDVTDIHHHHHHQSIMASRQQLAEDDALLKTIVHDATKDGDDEVDDELAKETEAMFLSTILHLLGEGEMYRDARIDAITAALRSAFLATTGKVDHDYIEKVLRVIREKDEQKRRLEEEHQTNVLHRSVLHSDESLGDGGFSIPPTPGAAAGKD